MTFGSGLVRTAEWPDDLDARVRSQIAHDYSRWPGTGDVRVSKQKRAELAQARNDYIAAKMRQEYKNVKGEV